MSIISYLVANGTADDRQEANQLYDELLDEAMGLLDKPGFDPADFLIDNGIEADYTIDFLEDLATYSKTPNR